MYNKGKNYTYLKDTYKVAATMLEQLSNLGVSFKVGDTSIALDNGKGLVKEHSFNTLVSNTIKSPQPQHVVEVNAFVANYINLALQAGSDSSDSKPTNLGELLKAKLDANTGESISSISSQKPKPKSAPSPYNKTSISQDDVNKLPVVKLRDAQALYQRVHGTSGGSIYRVVAMNDEIKVAARVQGNAVSVRVEGVITSSIEKAFSPLGVQKKSDEYMSGHFTCEKCTPQKLIGSILAGTGLEFTTPMPVISKVVG